MNQLLNWGLSWGFLLAALFTFLRLGIGFLGYTTSAGNPEKMESSRMTINYAVLGLLIVSMSWPMLKMAGLLTLAPWQMNFGVGQDREITVSQWVPVSVGEYRSSTDPVISTARSEILELETRVSELMAEGFEAGSYEERLVERYNSLVGAVGVLEQVFDSADAANYIDADGDGFVSYQEFNEGTGVISEAVYAIRHSKNFNYEDGIYDPIWNKIDVGSLPIEAPTQVTGTRVFVIVEAGIYDALDFVLCRYENDLEWKGYSVDFYRCNGCSRADVKAVIAQPGVAGALLVGNIPAAWYQKCDCWPWQETGECEVFPTDLYYMDIDGSWMGGGGSEISPYDRHHGDRYPERIVGRVVAPDAGSEVGMIINYFDKNHRYRMGRYDFVANGKSLNYFDDEWVGYWASRFSDEMSVLYSDQDVIEDEATTTAEDYMSRLQNVYEHVLICSHAGLSSLRHAFHIPGDPVLEPSDPGYADGFGGGFVYYDDILSVKPISLFYNLYTCSAARFTDSPYLAGAYIFQDRYGLVAVGSTKVGAMLGLEDFYGPLSQTADFPESLPESFGASLKAWFVNNDYPSVMNECWFYGMTLLGDPMLFARRYSFVVPPTDELVRCQGYDDPAFPPPCDIEWCGPEDRALCFFDGWSCVDNDSTCRMGGGQLLTDVGNDRYLHTDLNLGGNDNIAFCLLNSWLDCDSGRFYQTWCNPYCEVMTPDDCEGIDWERPNHICGEGLGVYAGESGVGEYLDLTTLGCCGDDAGEHYITENCDGTDIYTRCCNSASDKIDASGHCVTVCWPG